MSEFNQNIEGGNNAEMYMDTNSEKVMSVKDWIITFLITAIPLVGFIMLFVWAFGSGHNLNKSNYAKAVLIFTAIILILYFIIFAMFFGAIMSSFSNIPVQ